MFLAVLTTVQLIRELEFKFKSNLLSIEMGHASGPIEVLEY